jgi:hypothetical protein
MLSAYSSPERKAFLAYSQFGGCSPGDSREYSHLFFIGDYQVLSLDGIEL